MANKSLKGLTIKIGGDTSELLDSLKDVEKKGSDLSKELGQINKLLKLDPKNTQLLAQKQKVLADAVSNTEEKLDTLREAERQAQEQFKKGEISEAQYRALQREIIATEGKLDKYKQAVRETTEAEKRLADASEDAGEELEDQGRKTRDADDAADDLDDSATDLAKGGLAVMAAAATAAVTAIVALAESSREYRNEMAKLDTAFQDNGYSTEAATKTYEELQSVLGETEQAVEAANHIAALAKSEDDLAKWTEIATGVYAKFGASLPVEGLIEAANETIRVGQVTGPLADALNWAAKEGETFGVTLKENIKFTEYTSAALATLTPKQREEYEARKKQYKAIEEYNKKVAEATSAEDMFNIALENCTNEQERQKLITDFLTETYSSAATQFKKTNAEVIRSNQATEKWNKTTAKLGKTVEPVITDIKELGVTLLEDAEEPLQDTAEYIQTDVIPAIRSISTWVKNNGPTIKAAIVGVTTAMVAYKAATVSASIANNGLTKTLKATTVAQKALAIAQAATPWGLALTAIAAVTVAVGAYVLAADDAIDRTDALTIEERELMAAADEAAASFRDQKAAADEARQGITAQMKYASKLANELKGLADESGRVKKADQERAQLILNELNQALGTEYEMVDGVITKYKELKKSIDEVIRSKLANALLEASNEAYVAAVQNEARELENLSLKYEDYQNQLAVSTEAQKKADEAYKDYVENVRISGQAGAGAWALLYSAAQATADEEKKLLDEKSQAYTDSLSTYQTYRDTITTYEEAQAAALSGNFEKTVDLLAKKGGAYVEHSDQVDEETSKVVNSLYKEAIDAGLEAERTKRNFENGVKGYTEQMVVDAENDYAKAMDKFANAYADAEGVGKDLGDGLSDGMENKRSGLLAKARSLVTGIIGAMRKEADSNSPAQKTIDFGEDVGEGAEIGLENKTKDVKRAATDQASAILDAYRAEEVNAQRALNHVADQQAARQVAGQMSAASASSPLLEQILTAIQEGQVLTIDGNVLVGATSNRMDSALGRRRALAARGAIK